MIGLTAAMFLSDGAHAEKYAIPCVTQAAGTVSNGDVSRIAKGRSVIMEATTPEKGRTIAYVRDPETDQVIGWVDRKILKCP